MNLDKQRMAIAEYCGWNVFQAYNGDWRISPRISDGSWKLLPDYLNDLNAMHDAEKFLKGTVIKESYIRNLKRICCAAPEVETNINHFLIVHANAEAQAEAFLRAIGKWEE
jgi:hypothetical protein